MKTFRPVKLKNRVVLIVEVLVEAHSVLEAGTSAADNLDPEPGERFGLIQKNFLHLLFSFLRQGNCV